MPLLVNECSDLVKEARNDWCLLEALDGGTRKMRCEGQLYLPQWPAEEDSAYDTRRKTATLFPAWKRTVGVMSGKPFSEPLSLKDADTRIEKYAEDIDQQGRNLHSFASGVLREAIAYGLNGILVGYPDASGKRFRNRADEERAGLRPYWRHVKHGEILGWMAEQIDGVMQFTQLRLLETYEEQDGPFNVVCKPQVRVLYPGRWEIWREVAPVKTPQRGNVASPKSQWRKVAEGRTTIGVIPFVPVYGTRKDFMIGEAPLIELAHLNVKHWQSQSDQDTILHAARVPILAIIGADDQTQLVVGASTAVKLPMEADMKWVEHTGAAIDAGQQSIAALEEQMIQSGAELLVKKPGDRSATESANDAEGNKSDLQRIAENFEDALDQALVLTAMWIGSDKPGTVDLFDDYGAATLSDASAQLVLNLQQNGLVTKATALNELKRRGVLSADLDTEAEIAAAEEEGPAPGEMTDDALPEAA